jgi:LEA14-like dessication related protein
MLDEVEFDKEEFKEKLTDKRVLGAAGIVLGLVLFVAFILPFIPGLLMYLGVDPGFVFHPVNLEIESVEVDKVSVLEQQVDLTMNSEVQNPNFFPAKAGTLNYTVYIDGEKFTDPSLAELGTIEAKSSKSVDSEVNQTIVDTLTTGGNLIRDLGAKKRKPRIRVVGKIQQGIGPIKYSTGLNRTLSELK